MKDYLKSLEYLASCHKVSDIAGEVLNRPEFAVWSGSGSPEQHHYGDGGLIRHTEEVVNLCAVNWNLGKDDKNQSATLFLAALFHDVGKIYDYEKVDGIWRQAKHKFLIHHISRSAIIWTQAVAKYPQYKDIEDEVLHAILSHHGLREWGSPVTPQTKIAWMLHLCDGISARMDDCGTHNLYNK